MRLYPQYTSWDNLKDPDRQLVIGYVSPDYFTHSVSYFIEAPLAHHDYAKYKVVVYSAVVKVYGYNVANFLHTLLCSTMYILFYLSLCIIYNLSSKHFPLPF